MSSALGRIELVKRARPAPPDPQVSGFQTVVDRLLGVIDVETEALSRQIFTGLADLTKQKRQGMLELSRALRGFGDRPPEEVRERLAALTGALERNRSVLDVQLSAVREIAEIVAQVMRDVEWDGTYSARVARP